MNLTFKQIHQHGTGNTSVYFSDGKVPLGYSVLRPGEAGRMHMLEFVLYPEHRGKGLTRDIYRGLAEYLKPQKLASYDGPGEYHPAYHHIWAPLVATGEAERHQGGWHQWH